MRLTVEARCHMMWQQTRQSETHSGGQTHAFVVTACPRVYGNKKAAEVVLQRHALRTSLSNAAVLSTLYKAKLRGGTRQALATITC